jgi:NAD(P)-dependent dehydrogenase (short-subunit alcohol dehydrogenase family)
VLQEAPLSSTSDEAWDAILETNVIGPYLYAVAALPVLREAGGGSVTMISSDAGIWGETAIGAYSVSKRAVNMLVQTLAVEAGPAAIRVNAVCPGDTETAMEHADAKRKGWTWDAYVAWASDRPLGRMGRAEEVARAVLFLATDESSFVTGAALPVDGGGVAG